MISTKKLVKMARKWQRLAAIGRKRISYTRQEECNASSLALKGHFVIYTTDRKRFAIPLAYLDNEVFRQLLEISEEEFGLPSDGPITLPCDAIFLEYVLSLIRRGIVGNLHEALMTIAGSRCSSSSLHQQWRNQQLLVR